MKLALHRLFIAAAACVLGWIPTAWADPQPHSMRLEAKSAASASAGKAPDSPMPPIDTSAEAAAQPAVPGPLKTIVIDPGHGGQNAGAVGSANIFEKFLTLQVALLLADRLRALYPDTRILLTRNKDEFVSLADRIEFANRQKADLFISLHFNSSNNPEAVGFESFWVGDYWAQDLTKNGIVINDSIRAERTKSANLSQQMARCFNHAMRHRFDVLDRGVKPGDFTVLTRAEVPAVVLELAFLSHAQEGIAVTQQANRNKIIGAIVDAVHLYQAGKSCP